MGINVAGRDIREKRSGATREKRGIKFHKYERMIEKRH